MPQVSRGIRNHNPGNIERTGTAWQGMAADQSKDPRFIVFKSPQFGLRALAKVLLTYQNTHGLRTARGIINRWAPPNENNTDAYVGSVADALGVGPDDQIDIDQVAVMLPLMRAIVKKENQQPRVPWSDPYTERQYMEGMALAGVSDAKGKSPVKRIAALCTAGCASVGSAVTDTFTPERLTQAQGFLQPLVTISPFLKGLFVAITVGILGLTMFGLHKAHKNTGLQ